eukprot:m51a1_g5198 hypothetical protein (189) ;mRNA; f:210803-211509
MGKRSRNARLQQQTQPQQPPFVWMADPASGGYLLCAMPQTPDYAAAPQVYPPRPVPDPSGLRFPCMYPPLGPVQIAPSGFVYAQPSDPVEPHGDEHKISEQPETGDVTVSESVEEVKAVSPGPPEPEVDTDMSLSPEEIYGIPELKINVMDNPDIKKVLTIDFAKIRAFGAVPFDEDDAKDTASPPPS